MASRFPLQLSRLLVAFAAVAMIVGPLILAVDGGWPGGRSLTAELGSSLGIVALGMLGLLLALVGQPWRAQAAIGSTVAMAMLGATSARRRLHLSYATWRTLHGALATTPCCLRSRTRLNETATARTGSAAVRSTEPVSVVRTNLERPVPACQSIAPPLPRGIGAAGPTGSRLIFIPNPG